MATIKEIITTVCGDCGERALGCHECGKAFKDKDKIECKETVDGQRHTHKECLEN